MFAENNSIILTYLPYVACEFRVHTQKAQSLLNTPTKRKTAQATSQQHSLALQKSTGVA